MNDTRPAIEPLPARPCGGEVTAKDYVGHFMNEFGQELVFARCRGEKTARLWHGPGSDGVDPPGDRAGR
ncbi:hypothetical protein HEP87_28625 [Streptomyces sp. S1D4-11]|nr:hypothetical protein [Streptomyces sp. S1D4-11]QIY92907.1 hypothetical protein HEP87_28625 [Streptomyces sp. S1D4-11]